MMRPGLPILLLVLGAPLARADDPPSFAVTTDTAQYCAQLQKQVGDRHSTIPDVQHLLESGTDMCGKGEIRGGIRRLRHALVILHHHRPAKEPAQRDLAAKTTAPKDTMPKPGQPKQAAAIQKHLDTAHPAMPVGP